jgi:hypothetical protein
MAIVPHVQPRSCAFAATTQQSQDEKQYHPVAERILLSRAYTRHAAHTPGLQKTLAHSPQHVKG